MQTKYDVVVVGAGNAALCAALSAKENSNRVLVLEKGSPDKRGGNSFFTDGGFRFAYNSLDGIREVLTDVSDEEASKIEMPAYSSKDFYDDLMSVSGNRSDSELAHTLAANSFETVKWMKENGVRFQLNYDFQSFEKEGKHHFWGGIPIKHPKKGVGLMENLFRRVSEVGIDIWYNSPAIELLKNDNKISGVVVKKDHETVTVETSSVILASGGFEASKQLRIEHLGPEWEKVVVRGTEHNTGDGHAMAIEAGAGTNGQWTGCHTIGTDFNAPKYGDFTKPGDIFKKHSYPLGIMINKKGERFVDEGADLRNFTYAKYGREVLKQPDHMAYQLYDSKVRNMLRSEYNLKETTEYQADTLEELLNKLDIDRDAALKTIEAYNDAVQEGEYIPSEKDGKSTKGIHPPKSNWALEIDEGPFYAYPITCAITFTFGGLKVNSEAKVIEASGTPIEGLFAAGEMIGGLFYDNYPGGSGLMSGAVFGKIAGQSASIYANKEVTVK